MVVLIIFPVIFQTDINLIMMSIEGEGKWTRWTPTMAVPCQ